MEKTFCGMWSGGDGALEIRNAGKTFVCSLGRPNIGMIFEDSLVVSEFDGAARVGGVGVYSPVGDGSASFALWSSTNIPGQLGSGIVLKSQESPGFTGDCAVRYFVGDREVSALQVSICPAGKEGVYGLTWNVDGKPMLHGIGLVFGSALALAWGSPDGGFDVSVIGIGEAEGKPVLRKRTVVWGGADIVETRFGRAG